jgi:hypothetical protein
MDLGNWDVIHFDETYGGPDGVTVTPPAWVTSTPSTTVTQEINADASIYVGDLQLASDRIRGTWRVDDVGSLPSGNADDDFIGFVFGYQDDSHFYLFDWKAVDQESANRLASAGMTIKVVNAESPLTKEDLWGTDGNGDRVQTLFHNSIPWQNHTDYGFDLEFHPRIFTITVTQGEATLDKITIYDDTYTDGRFGFYNYSQGLVSYSSFTQQSVPEITYRYDADAVDPDFDPVSYSLLDGPDGMQIDPATGMVTWAPTVDQLNMAEQVEQDPSLPVAPGFDVEVYAEVTDPMELSFGPDGSLYVGRENSGSGGGNRDAVKVHRVAPGGREVEELGVVAISDPDTVLFDADGSFTGVPGSLLVGGLTGATGFVGQISVIRPDGTVETVFNSSTVLGNVSSMAYDTTGRLVFFNASANQVLVSDGEFPEPLFSTVPASRIAIDGQNRIFTSGNDGVIRIHASDGTLIDDAFATGLGTAPKITFGPGGIWGRDLYCIVPDTEELLRIDASGNVTVVATGMSGFKYDLKFGPDGSLYVSDRDDDRILRIAPSRETLGLQPNQHPVTIVASDGRGGTAFQSYNICLFPDPDNHPPVIVSEPVTTVSLAGSGTLGDTITFESVLGEPPTDGMVIDTQFQQSHGVTFSLEGGGAPVLAKVGAPVTAFYGPPDKTPDTPAAGQGVGSFFLTDDGVVGGIPQPLIITYSDPVAAASAVILDIDAAVLFESWLIEARDENAHVIDVVALGPESINAGDGLATRWSFVHASPDIHSIRVVYTGTKTNGVGLAFDNFSPSSAGFEYQYDVDAVDPDGDQVTYSLTESPEGMTIDRDTGLIEWSKSADWLTENQVTFFDGDFDPADWELITFIEPAYPATTASVATISTDGDPASYRKITHLLPATNNTEPGSVFSFHRHNGATYDLSQQGAIFAIDYSESYRYFSGPSGGQGTGPALVQNGLFYVGPSTSTGDSTTWKSTSLANLRAEDFRLVEVDKRYLLDNTRHPDFSQDASQIEFGFFRSNFSWLGSTGGTTVSGIDNWGIVVTPVANENVTVRVEDGRGGNDEQSYDLTSAHPGAIEGFNFHDQTQEGMWTRGSELIVTGGLRDPVLRYDAATGAFIAPLVSRDTVQQISHFAFGPDGYLYASDPVTDSIYRLDAQDGSLVGVFASGGSIVIPRGLAFDSDGDLYVACEGTDSVLKFNGQTGEFLGTFASGGGLNNPRDMEFGPDGDLYVIAYGIGDRRIHRYDGETGQHILAFEQALNDAHWLAVGPDGYVYASERSLDQVVRFNATSGAFAGVFVTANSGGLEYPSDLAFGPDGNLYVASVINPAIVIFDGSTGAYLDKITSPELFTPGQVYFTPDVDASEIEPPLPGWTIYLDLNRNYRRDGDEPFTVTDEKGHYSFTGLAAGTYIVAQDPQLGWAQSAPGGRRHDITIEAGETVYNVNFGNYQGDQNGEIDTNLPPNFTGQPPTSAEYGELLRYEATAVDPNLDPLTFDMPSGPTGMTIHPDRGVLVWSPTSDQIGLHQIVLRVQDGRGGVDLQSFTITVTPQNSPPVFTSIPPDQAIAELPYVYRLRAQDADGDLISFSLDTFPSGMTLVSRDMLGADGTVFDKVYTLQWTPETTQLGTHAVTVVVEDTAGNQTLQTYELTVSDTGVNTPPEIHSTPRTSTWPDAPYAYLLQAYDADGDPLTYHLDESPADMTITEQDGLVQWRPTADQIGSHPVTIRVEDGRGEPALQTFTIQVTAQGDNRAPWIASTPPRLARLLHPYSYDVKARDPDGDAVTWTLDEAPDGMSIHARNGTLRWTPRIDQLGVHSVVVRATDPLQASTTQSFTIVVNCNNQFPSISSTPPTEAEVSWPYVYAVRATDPEGDTLHYSLLDRPDGMSIDYDTGVVRWTPQPDQVGMHSVQIVVTDGAGGHAQQTFSVEVAAAEVRNLPPVITSTPRRSAALEETYQYQVTARDYEGDELTYSLERFPAGMSMDPDTHLITWDPDETQAGEHTVTIVVTDEPGGRATQTFILTASENQPPEITSLPITTAMAGETYRYDVRAKDPEQQPLTYRLDQAPSGMTIDSRGRIIWQLAHTLSGSADVTVVVTDSMGASASPQSYTITIDRDDEPPKVQLAASGSLVDQGRTLQFELLATDNVGVESTELLVDGAVHPISWRKDRFWANVVFNNPGFSYVVARATDLAGNVGQTDPWEVRVKDPNDQEAPQIEIIKLEQNGRELAIRGRDVLDPVTYLADLFATIQDDNLEFWRVEYARVDQVNLNAFAAEDPDYVLMAQGTASVTDPTETIATFDPTILANDAYVIRIYAQDINGWINTRGLILAVSGEAKLGNLHLEFTDLVLPLAGIPIQVDRGLRHPKRRHRGRLWLRLEPRSQRCPDSGNRTRWRGVRAWNDAGLPHDTGRPSRRLYLHGGTGSCPHHRGNRVLGWLSRRPEVSHVLRAGSGRLRDHWRSTRNLSFAAVCPVKFTRPRQGARRRCARQPRHLHAHDERRPQLPVPRRRWLADDHRPEWARGHFCRRRHPPLRPACRSSSSATTATASPRSSPRHQRRRCRTRACDLRVRCRQGSGEGHASRCESTRRLMVWATAVVPSRIRSTRFEYLP